jgi:hypothetical protein
MKKRAPEVEYEKVLSRMAAGERIFNVKPGPLGPELGWLGKNKETADYSVDGKIILRMMTRKFIEDDQQDSTQFVITESGVVEAQRLKRGNS